MMKTLTHSCTGEPKVSPQAHVATQGYGNKGLCLYCGEIFNMDENHPDGTVCPDCLEVFDGDPELDEAGAAGKAT